ncbi:transmembrane protein, putative [Medicago truncatula]|nr:transmembrane protein, putative [Medicago truncatula]
MITRNYKAYFFLMGLLVTLASTKYEALNTNPFQPLSPTMLLFLTSLCCHAVSSTADMSLSATIYIFHFSGVVGCETLLWIILSQISNWCIVNSFILVVTFLCHTNCIKLVHKLSCHTLDLFFLSKHSNSDVVSPPPNSEPQEASQV